MKKFLIFILSFLFFGCTTDLSKIPSPIDIKSLPQLTVENFHSFYKVSSKLKVETTAPLMNKYSLAKNYVEFPEGVKIIFYDENFEPTTTLVCKYAINYPDEDLWKFADNVILKSKNGGILSTNELFFDQKNEKIYSLKFVQVVDTDGNIIRGKGGFEANYDFTVYEFKNVDGTLIFTDEDF